MSEEIPTNSNTQPKTKEEQKEVAKLRNMAKATGCQFGKLAQDQKFYVGNMALVDSDGTLNLSADVINITKKELMTRAPDTAFMLVTASDGMIKLTIHVPESRDEITAQEWMEATSVGGPEKVLEEGEFLKFRDLVINEAINYLKSKNLLQDAEEEGVCYTFDD